MSASASSSSRRARRRRAPVAATADEPMMDINTTPLIDVMLVLLIMLIITIPVQLDAIHMQLPVGAAPPPQEPPPEPLRIDVGADGTVLWNGEALPDTGALDRRLEALAAQPVPQDIHLRPDRQAPYAVVAHVLASAQRDGLSRLAIVGSEQFAP